MTVTTRIRKLVSTIFLDPYVSTTRAPIVSTYRISIVDTKQMIQMYGW